MRLLRFAAESWAWKRRVLHLLCDRKSVTASAHAKEMALGQGHCKQKGTAGLLKWRGMMIDGRG